MSNRHPVKPHRLAKDVAKDHERICGACGEELDTDSMKQWIHMHTRKSVCKNTKTGALSWAHPRAISYTRFEENGYTYDNIHHNEEKKRASK